MMDPIQDVCNAHAKAFAQRIAVMTFPRADITAALLGCTEAELSSVVDGLYDDPLCPICGGDIHVCDCGKVKR